MALIYACRAVESMGITSVCVCVCVHNYTKKSFGKSVCSAARVHLCTFPDKYLFGVPLLKAPEL